MSTVQPLKGHLIPEEFLASLKRCPDTNPEFFPQLLDRAFQRTCVNQKLPADREPSKPQTAAELRSAGRARAPVPT